MGETDRFRAQHRELAQLGARLHARTIDDVVRDPRTVRREVATFTGKLLVHAAMENGALYPSLFAHEHASVRTRAHELFDEVGAIYARFAEYTKRWPTAESLAASPAEFLRETQELLALLYRRLRVEDYELYPMLEAASEDEPASRVRAIQSPRESSRAPHSNEEHESKRVREPLEVGRFAVESTGRSWRRAGS